MAHDMTGHNFATITVSLEDREDGGARVCSADLPGLILSSPDRRKVIEAIVPTMTTLLGKLGFQDIEVHPSKTVQEILDGGNPQDVDVHIQQFVVEYRKAA